MIISWPGYYISQEISDSELLFLAGPLNDPYSHSSRLSSVVADSARRWLSATDREQNEGDTSSSEDDRERELM